MSKPNPSGTAPGLDQLLRELVAQWRDEVVTMRRDAESEANDDKQVARLLESADTTEACADELDAALVTLRQGAEGQQPTTASEAFYQGQVIPMIEHVVEQLKSPTLKERISEWRKHADEGRARAQACTHGGDTHSALYEEGRAFAFERCADEAETALKAASAPPPETGWREHAEQLVICERCQMKIPARLATFGIGVRGGDAAWCAVCRMPEGSGAEAKRVEVVAMRKAKLSDPPGRVSPQTEGAQK